MHVLIKLLFTINLFLLTFLCGQSTNITPEMRNKLIQSGVTLDQINQATGIIENQANNDQTGDLEIDDQLQENTIDEIEIKSELNKIYEADKSIKEYIDLSEESEQNQTTDNLDNEDEINKNEDESSEETNFNKENILINQDTISTKYFGYNTFLADPEYFQKTMSESINPDYIIGPGDEIIIMLWGDTQLNKKLYVSREGYLYIKDVGQIFVNGLTLEKLEKKLFRIFKKAYSSLDPDNGNASTFFDVSLGSLALRPLRIFVAGEVAQPGAYSMKGSASLFTSLYYFKGPKISGSLRNVQLIRNGKEKANIDFYDFLLTGKTIDDIRLQRDDVVFIPPRGKTVEAEGEIMRKAIYELKEKEGLIDLINIAGGPLMTTYMKRIQIDRILPPKDRVKKGMDRVLIDLSLDEILSSKENYNLYDGDRVRFFDILGILNNSVKIIGSVKRPGPYALDDEMKFMDLINKAEGLLGDAYTERADIYRLNSDLITKTQLTINIGLALNEDPEHNIKLINGDEINIYSKTDMIYRDNVSIEGHVLNPGSKPLFDGMTLSDLIFAGGGFNNDKHLDFTYFDRADLFRINEDGITKSIITFRLDSVLAGVGIAELPLQIGDRVTIYSLNDITGLKDKTVDIDGHVKKPGNYLLYDYNMTINDLLFIAGGFEDKSFLSLAYMERAELLRFDKLRNHRKIIPFRLDSLLAGKGISGLKLEDKDRISVYAKDQIQGTIDKIVTIDGNVKFPGEYQLADENMRVYDLIFKAGSLEDPELLRTTFMHRVDLIRQEPQKLDKIIIPLSLKKIIADKNSEFNLKLMPGDLIRVYKNSQNNMQRVVTIDGDVTNPGPYELKNKMKLQDLILEAGGPLSEDSIKTDVHYYRADIARIDPNNDDEDVFAELITLELVNNEELFTLEFSSDFRPEYTEAAEFELKENDLITLRRDPYFSRQRKVSISGMVYYPGEYVLKGPGEYVTDIIDRAGGLRPEAYPIASELNRNGKKIMLSFDKILKNPRSKLNFKLLPGDDITINSRPNLVIIDGAVNTPGNYQYIAGSSVSDYLRMAGGLNKEASRYATFVTYPNGMSKKVRVIGFSPAVYDGSIINVGMKAEVERFSFTEYASNLTAIYSDFMQAYLLIKLVGQE